MAERKRCKHRYDVASSSAFDATTGLGDCPAEKEGRIQGIVSDKWRLRKPTENGSAVNSQTMRGFAPLARS